MERRKLGALEVSALGLGCATMTPFYSEPDPASAIDTIRRAAELGIDFLDTCQTPSRIMQRRSPATRLALAICMVAGQTIPAAQAVSERYDPAAATAAICRGYAAAQRGLPYDTMYAQCMYARGYLVPGFSPSPNSPGYQGELPGPGAIGGGH